jgi:lipopolysaccharide/colanic/teichoic acid biosynthesis glycosyltransferase
MLKRLIDIFISLIVIISCAPFIAAILFLVFFITREKPILLQERKITLDKEEIKIIKIRTIRNSLQFLELKKLSQDIFFKNNYVRYVPSFCRWLRKTGLDEILQVFNVLKGEMSLVGPRPLLGNDLIIMKKTDPEFYYRRTKIESKPGITGCWQVFGKRTKGIADLVELDEKYDKKKSVLFDFNIIFKTLLICLTASHSDSIIMETSEKTIYSLPNRFDSEFS